MQNNFNQFNQFGNFGGTTYAPAMPKAANNNPVTKEWYDILTKDDNDLNMKIDEKDLVRASCTHKHPVTGANMLYTDSEGFNCCPICGARFHFFEGTVEEVEQVVNKMEDILQTCKAVYLDAPNEFTRQYYQLIPLLRRLAKLYKHACNNFSKYDNSNTGAMNIGVGYNGFNAMANMLNNPYNASYNMMPNNGMMQPGYGMMPNGYGMMPNGMQPGYGMMPNNGMQPGYGMMPNNGMQPGYGMMPDNSNPMAFGAPAVGNIPTANNAPAENNAQQSAPANNQPAPAGEVTQHKVFNV